MNAAIAAARLGAPTAFAGRISTDSYGTQIWEHLLTNHVNVRACERGPEPTARSIVEHTPKVAYRFEGQGTVDTKLTKVDLTKLGKGPHILHGGTLGMFRGETAETLARLVEQHHGIVSLDPNIRPGIIDDRDAWLHYHERWSARANIYKASDEDLDWIWPGQSPESCAERLLEGAARIVLVTLGGDGCRVFIRSDEISIPGVTVDVVDTVGAGDTFIGSVLASLWNDGPTTDPSDLERLDSGDWQMIASRAVLAAAITCSRPGADPPWADELPT